MNTGFTGLEGGATSTLLDPVERIVLDHLVNSVGKTAGPLCKQIYIRSPASPNCSILYVVEQLML
jgi:hypothetical protein